MGLSVKKLLDEYFYKEEIQDALDDIGEPVSGSKDELIGRLLNSWELHNRDIYQLLDFIKRDSLMMINDDYNLGILPAKPEVVRRRIKKANLLGSGGKPKESLGEKLPYFLHLVRHLAKIHQLQMQNA